MPNMEVHYVQTPQAGAEDCGYPVIGDTTTGLGEYLVKCETLKDLDAYARVRADALAIVRRARRFTEVDGTRTGLVVGYVQSGKTMSMTTVSALARDNGCRVVILLAGITTNLLKQNASRFRDSLRNASGKATAWRIFNSQDGLGAAELGSLQQAVAEWRDPRFGEQNRQTFLFLVLKNHAHLDRLHGLLRQVDLRGVPALIIDDEADQAGLNTSPGGAEGSTTYERIAKIRRDIPHHTYLQYTATPQAPLLIALDDLLSPDFAELVEPGDGYTGGQSFFGVAAPAGVVHSIPADDLFRPGAPPAEPPESLLQALRVFFVGSAVWRRRGHRGTRSMLVHPSPRQADHATYLGWVRAIVSRWVATLRGSDVEERSDTLAELRAAYNELAATDGALPPFAELEQSIEVSLARVSLKEVNSQDGVEIDWGNADEHVLVGGEKLNRGFTVEGLTVTYMPRDAGGWNADTIQQRARFFGYKAGYLSLCRLYLHPDVIEAYRAYVRHEVDIRGQLAAFRGRPLREWRRAFFLDARLRPTRRNVLSEPLYRVERDQLWFAQRYPHMLEADAILRNRSAIAALMSGLSFDARAGYHGHGVTEVNLYDVFGPILVAFEVRGPDVHKWYGQLVMLGDVLEANSTARMQLVQMRLPRERKLTGDGINPHQGRSASKGANAYPGDRALCDSEIVTLQMSDISLKDEGGRCVPCISLHIPAALRKDDVLVQVG